MTYLKSLPAVVKTTAAEDDGVVEALVATYDVDSIGDRIVPGAFAKSLDDWQHSGHPIPFIWSHLHDDLDAYIGDVLEAAETDDGLLVKAQVDMSDAKSAKAFRLLKSGRVHNYSFAYDVVDAEQDGDVNLLRELRLYEVGPCLIGMNQQTRTLVAKHRPAKRGRVLSATNETDLRDALTAITRVLAQLDDQSSDDEEQSSQSTEPAKDEHDDDVAKSEEPTPSDPLDDDLAAEIALATERGRL
jgi:hypothetical protein